MFKKRILEKHKMFWKAFPRIVQLTSTFLVFLSSTIDPFIYAARNRVFREEFRKLLCWWKVKSATSVADSGASQKRGRCKKKKTPETATPFPDSLFFPSKDGKDKDQGNPENEVTGIDL